MAAAQKPGNASIGVSAHLGWAAVAAVEIASSEKRALRVLYTGRIETADPGDREAKEPYHVAGGFDGLDRVPRPADPAASVERGLRKQRRHTARALARVEKELASEGRRVGCAGILVSRGRAAKDLEKAIGSHTQIHIEEGLAVRESLRRALAESCRSARWVSDIDQKSVVSIASEELAMKEAALLAVLGAAKPGNGGPWRKEEKTAALAAWIAWARAGRKRPRK